MKFHPNAIIISALEIFAPRTDGRTQEAIVILSLGEINKIAYPPDIENGHEEEDNTNTQFPNMCFERYKLHIVLFVRHRKDEHSCQQYVKTVD